MARKNQEKAIRQAAERAASAAEEDDKANETPATQPPSSGVVDLSAKDTNPTANGSSIVIVTEPRPTG